MKRPLLGWIFLGMLLVVSTGVTSNAEVIDDFQSYSDTKALKRAWTFDPYQGAAQLITSYDLMSEKANKYLEIKANLKDEPYFAILQKQLSSPKNWSMHSRVMIKYRRVTGASKEQFVFEILDASDWSHKWRSVSWYAPDEGAWRTQTIDISKCPWLKKVGVIRIVVKAKDYGMTTVDIDDIQLK
jgi:hypothetical protein